MHYHFVTKFKQRFLFFAIGLGATIGSFAQQIPPVRIFQVDTALYPKGEISRIIPFRGAYITTGERNVLVKEGQEILLSVGYLKEQFPNMRDEYFLSNSLVGDGFIYNDVYYGDVMDVLYRQKLDGSEYVSLEDDFPSFHHLQFDPRNERVIVNMEMDVNPRYKIFDGKTLKELKSGKGTLSVSISGRYFMNKPKVYNELIELDPVSFKPIQTFGRQTIEDGNEQNNYRFNMDFSTYEGYQVEVLPYLNYKSLIYLSNSAGHYLQFPDDSDPFNRILGIYDLKNYLYYYIHPANKAADIIEKNILTGAERIIYSSDYKISALAFNADTTAIHIGINQNRPSYAKEKRMAKEYAERMAKEQELKAEQERQLAEERKREQVEKDRIQAQKDSLQKIENERLAEIKRQEKIKIDAMFALEKQKSDSAYLKSIGFYLKSKNGKLKKLNPAEIVFKKRGYGIFKAVDKDETEWYTAFNYEAIVVLSPQKKQVAYYAYPVGSNPEEFDIRLMYNNHYMLINHRKSELWIFNPVKGVMGSVYAFRENSQVLRQIRFLPRAYGLSVWNSETRRLDQFFLRNDKLLLQDFFLTAENTDLTSNHWYAPTDTTDKQMMEQVWNQKPQYLASKGKKIFWYEIFNSNFDKYGTENFVPVVNSNFSFTFLSGLYDLDNYLVITNSIDPIGYSSLYESDGLRIRKYNDENEKISLKDLPVLVENYSEGKGFYYQFYALNGDEYEYEKYRQRRYKANNSFLNQGYDQKLKRRLVWAIDPSGKAYILGANQEQVQTAIQVNNAAVVESNAEISSLLGTRTLVETIGAIYGPGENPPVRADRQAEIDDYHREQAAKRAQDEANRQTEEAIKQAEELAKANAKPPKENLTEGIVTYKGVSQQDLVIEIQVKVWYENVRVKDLVFNAYNWEKKIHYEEPIRFRYPQNTQQWLSFSSNSFYECGDYENRIFSYPQRCASIQGVVFGLIRVD